MCVWVCALQHKREGPLLCYRLGHGCVALIIPLSAHNESLAACHIQRAKLVINVMALLRKTAGFLCLRVLSDLIFPCLRYQILAWPGGMACHGLMTSVETVSAAPLPICRLRASLRRTEFRTPSMMYTGWLFSIFLCQCRFLFWVGVCCLSGFFYFCMFS